MTIDYDWSIICEINNRQISVALVNAEQEWVTLVDDIQWWVIVRMLFRYPYHKCSQYNNLYLKISHNWLEFVSLFYGDDSKLTECFFFVESRPKSKSWKYVRPMKSKVLLMSWPIPLKLTPSLACYLSVVRSSLLSNSSIAFP